MKTILFVHQSAELYGSDKTLYNLVRDLAQHQFRAIVVLPNEGPLAILLREAQIELIISPIIKLSRSTLSFKNSIQLPFKIISSLKEINRKLANETIDIVHSNTLAVLLGAFYAKQKKIKHIWHIHEIIEKPKILNSIYRHFVSLFAAHVVFNSKASFESLVKTNQKLRNKSSIIYNGVETPKSYSSEKEIKELKTNQLKFPADNLIIGIVGRISRWKGHNLLLDVFSELQHKNQNLNLLIVGSPPADQMIYLTQLQSKIASKGLENKITLIPFTSEIQKYWACIDIAVVPSTEPEPFGLVAVEAMQNGKPVVAAKHGGLLEIIEHNKTGLLFEPSDSKALYSSLDLLIKNEELRKVLGNNGKAFVKDHFKVDEYVLNFVKLYQNLSE